MRAHGEGTLRKRPNGVWEGRLTLDGKQLSFYNKVQREVLKRMRDARDAAENNEALPMPSQQKTVAHLVDEWLATKRLRNNTLSAYKAYLKNHILPELGSVLVAKLTPGMVERFLAGRKNKVTGEELSAKSQQQVRAILQ
ncbi:MAG TPA: N-terminal phage integrase SAM-like domain-containing protein, partial [Chloroflexota bacterium]|nr:N-terminal phage integrase SAM-like domain-containing protein [Chloroflexota bacterium]